MNLVFAILYSFIPFCSSTNLDQASDLQSIELEHDFFKESCEFHVQLTSFINTKFTQVATDELNIRMGFLALLRLTVVVTQVRIIPLRNELLLGANQNDEISNRILASDEEIDEAVTWSFERGALEFVHEILLGQPNFHCTPFPVLFVHSLITDLIANMPLRVRELRLKDEECIRRSGQDPSQQGSGFARLLNLLSDLYDVPGSPLHARLSIEFWWPSSNELLEFNTETQHTRDLTKKTAESNQSNADNMKQAALLRFLRQVADMIPTAHSLFVPFLRLLKALSLSKPAATHCFNMLHSSSSAHNPGLQKVSLISWEHFLASLHQYYEHLCQSMEQNPDDATNSGARCRNIQPEEMDGLIAVLQLIRRVVSMQPKVADVLCGGDQKLHLIIVCFGLMSCPVSLSLKAELLLTVSAFARISSARGAAIWSLFATTSLLAPHIWTFFDNNRWLSNPDPALPSTSLLVSAGLVQQDSAEVAAHKSRLANGILRFLVDCIFLKHSMRLYTNPEEKGEIASSCLLLFNLMVRQFVARLNSLDLLPNSSPNLTPPNWPLTDPGYQLANSILMGSQLFKVIFGVLQLSSHLLQKCQHELSRIEYGSISLSSQLNGIPRSTLAALDMFLHLVQYESQVIALTRRTATQQNLSDKNLSSKLAMMENNSSLVPLSLFSKLLLSHVNSSTGQADFSAALLRYVALASYLPRHATGHRQLLNQLLTSEKASAEIMETLVACLDEESKKHDMRMLEDHYPETPLVPNLVETWTFSVGHLRSWDPQQKLFGHSQLDLGAPNQKLAAIHAGVPSLSSRWPVQFLTSWPQMPSWNHLYVATFEPQPQLRTLLLKLFLKMLKELDQPNLVHWALGFRVDDHNSLRNSVLQDAGVANCPKTCLHAFLALISRGTNILRTCIHQLNNSRYVSSFEENALATSCDLGIIWHILYQVAQDNKTGDILLRYLRYLALYPLLKCAENPLIEGDKCNPKALSTKSTSKIVELYVSLHNRSRNDT
ncbi:hypothetical protein Ciccas_003906 [Cichlidogyrus casuarinus]|uniref:Uncharacterized protein n=1 Tax=Cichlidogyrus casuarinus TaxID=1844966 RepID=A0ABD2QD61_9PLAT